MGDSGEGRATCVPRLRGERSSNTYFSQHLTRLLSAGRGTKVSSQPPGERHSMTKADTLMAPLEQAACTTAAWSVSAIFSPERAIATQNSEPLLAGLLEQAIAVLDGDRERASAFLMRASALLEAAIEAKSIDNRIKSRGGCLAAWQARKIIAHIESHLEAPLYLDELACTIGLSRSYFTRAFRRSFETSPHDFIIKRRIERAKVRMLEAAEPLSQVALTCGFTDQAHFSRVFRRIVGRAPFEWRRIRLLNRSDIGSD